MIKVLAVLLIALAMTATVASAKTCQEYVVETRNGNHHYAYRWVDC